MSDGPWKLPEGWEWTTLGEICEINPRRLDGDLPGATPVSFVPMSSVDARNGELGDLQLRSLAEVRKGFTPFKEGDVLFAKITPCMENGKSAIARGLVNGIGFGTTEFHVLRPLGGIPSEFVFRYVRQKSFRGEAAGHMTGTAGQLRVPKDYLASAAIPLPPLAEQRQIVAKIEALCAGSRVARQALDRVPQLTKRFWQAVIAKAFRGELTAREEGDEPALVQLHRIWEERQANEQSQMKHNPEKQELADTGGLRELPRDWAWATLGDIILSTQTGFASGKKDVAGGIAHLRMNNIGSDCNLNLSVVRTVPKELALEKYLLKSGDVLLCHTNSPKLVGKTALFALNDGRRYAFSNHLTRIRINPNVTIPGWVWHNLATLWRQGYFETRCKQWVNQATIERGILLSTPIPLAPFAEQQRIVSRIESLFSQNSAIEAAAREAWLRFDRLDQAVLAKAFRGDLAEQDPHDEPVSVLLEQVRSQRGTETRSPTQQANLPAG
ncbi:MAG TPA: restriction endonuclease subunit S [Thermoplasmata archaeon]